MITGRTSNQSAWSKIPSGSPAAQSTSRGSDRVTLGSTHTPEKKKSDFWGWLDKVTDGINSFSAELQKSTGDPNQLWLYDNLNNNSCKPHQPSPPPAYCPKSH